jgi:hypothetical protein
MEVCFPLRNKGLPLSFESSFCYMLPPYSHLHLDLGYATISPPPSAHLLLLKAQIYKILPSTTAMRGLSFAFDTQPRNSDLPFEVPLQNTMIYLSLERPPPEPPPHVNHISSTLMERQPPKPPTLQMTEYDLSILNLGLERPPQKPSDKASTFFKVVRKPESYLGRLPPTPPWVILNLGCLVLFELCFI